jgi:hypothetical protein
LTLHLRYSHHQFFKKKTIEVAAEELLSAYKEGGDEKQGSDFLVIHNAI